MSDISQAIIQDLANSGLPIQLAMSVARGDVTEDDAWGRHELTLATDALLQIPVADWPSPEIAWDVSQQNWHLALDGVCRSKFDELYPEVEVITVDAEAVRENLHHSSVRHETPFDKRYRSTTCRLIAHLHSGGAVSPPLITLHDGRLFIAGGNHRFGWALHKGARSVPILVRASEEAEIKAKLAAYHPSQ